MLGMIVSRASSSFKMLDSIVCSLKNFLTVAVILKIFVITTAPTFTKRLVGGDFISPAISCLKIIYVHASGAIQVLLDLIFIIIIGFLINVQVQGQYPLQWAPFQVAG